MQTRIQPKAAEVRMFAPPSGAAPDESVWIAAATEPALRSAGALATALGYARVEVQFLLPFVERPGYGVAHLENPDASN